MSAQTTKEWKDRNRERVKRVEKERYRRKSEAIRRKTREWYLVHRDDPEVKEQRRKHKRNAQCSRRARTRQQFVEHVDAATVLERSLGMCGICGKPIEYAFHVDHIVPLSRGGSHAYANVQAAHPGCNTRKGARGGDAQ